MKNEGSTPHTFQIYQIFSGDLDESKTLSNIQWGTGIKEASKETLGTAAEKAQTLTGESEAKEFAKTIQEHLNEDNKLEVRVEKNDSTTVANLNAGYYLIKDKEGSQTQAIQFYIHGKEGGYAVKQNNRLRSKDCVLFKQ